MSGVYTKKCPDDTFDGSDESLPVELQRVAEAELGETPAKRRDALAKLTRLLQVEPDLNANRDAEFLLRFLRVRKYNVEAALQNIRNYCRNRSATESLYREFLPSTAPAAARKMVMILPHKDVHGRPVLLVKLGSRCRALLPIRVGRKSCIFLSTISPSLSGSWMRDEVSYPDLHRAGLFCLEHLARDPAAQDCMPIRLKAAHHVRQSYAFDVFFALVRPFIKTKLAERVGLHGQNFKRLHEEISPKALPEEYGGQRPPLDPAECWKAVDADRGLHRRLQPLWICHDRPVRRPSHRTRSTTGTHFFVKK